jgi:hypothetical protein
MSDFGNNPPPGTAIITKGTVADGDWFFIKLLGAWALCPKSAFGESVEGCGHIIARSILDEHNVAKRAEQLWKN